MSKEIHTHPAGYAAGKVAVVGLGFVGLPLAVAFARQGFDVVGIDTDQRKIGAIRAGKSYIRDIADDELGQAAGGGKLAAATDYAEASSAGAVIVCVPTPLSPDNAPDLGFLTDAASRLAPVLRPGQLIVIESSTYPGTTNDVVRPILEQSGLRAGTDFFLAYSPERVDPGNDAYPLRAVPKVISGATARCLERIRDLYGHVFERLVAVSSMEIAETAKLLENAYRLVNISFINEFAQLCDALNLNVWDVIRAAATKPYGFSPFYPGPGIGGHCIPVDPLYLQWKAAQAGTESRFIALSQAVNDAMPAYIVGRVQAHLPAGKPLSGARVLVYGVTYKRDVPDVRESPSLAIIEALRHGGADVRYHDPYVPSLRLADDTTMNGVPVTAEELAAADCVLILVDHAALPEALIAGHARFVFDTRSRIRAVRAGAKLVTLGDGTPT
ncbi:nucleotide sugar dehydrogenase [Paenibacillus sp. MWE-103]|uniref:Nucleotide sugar dehydrogenase n=1 Tax=Paenibacillus artemisiicola TaxID=1172618 RepID=A0ABS3WKX4_9BACL|nr:nucleotide sugar dehydrogenase [Paenibacillus artemisiicola]MBO7748970.1 nucleotide sugar dehydrogenase [Paenibacillus artemisiicola]